MPYKDLRDRKAYFNQYRRDRYATDEKYRQKQKDRRNARRRSLYEMVNRITAESGCIKCGEDHPACLDFHHRDPDQKVSAITDMVRNGLGKARILAEIAKCDILCANCHRKLHWQRGLPEN